MKFADIPPGDPWFQTDETRALVGLLRDRKASAFSSVVAKVRENDTGGAREYLGHADALGQILKAIQEGE